jgi:hypothetical protein
MPNLEWKSRSNGTVRFSDMIALAAVIMKEAPQLGHVQHKRHDIYILKRGAPFCDAATSSC